MAFRRDETLMNGVSSRRNTDAYLMSSGYDLVTLGEDSSYVLNTICFTGLRNKPWEKINNEENP
jgi:hypothetical protein